MTIYELTLKVYLKQDVKYNDSYNIISKFISYSMSQANILKQFHINNHFKFYVHNTFSPTQKSGVYKKDNIYSFKIRSLDELFITSIIKLLKQNVNNKYLLIVDTNLIKISPKVIKKLYTLTPTIITLPKSNNEYWKINNSNILQLIEQLNINLLKKYNSFTNSNIQKCDFINSIKLLTPIPQAINASKNDKKFKFIGHKFEIIPNSDELSQKLAIVAIGAGIGEKNSYGGGFCLFK